MKFFTLRAALFLLGVDIKPRTTAPKERTNPAHCNEQFGNESSRKTFVVLGCPRGGTSLLAGALSTAGVFMGEYRTNQYEDPEFKIPPLEAKHALNRLTPIIEKRNREHAYWGWKVPNNIYYIDQLTHLLINPCYLLIYRDPIEIAKSSAKHDNRRPTLAIRRRLLQIALGHTERVKYFARSIPSGQEYHVFNLEEIHENPDHFADKMARITSPLNPDKELILKFVYPGGGYHPQPNATNEPHNTQEPDQ